MAKSVFPKPAPAPGRIAVRVRGMRKKEAGEVLLLIRRFFPKARVGDILEEDRLVLVAEACGRVVGFADARVAGDAMRLLGLGVEGEFAGSGVGSALLEEAVERAFGIGCGAVRLLVKAGNARAVSFYESHGFVKKSERKGSEGVVFLMERKKPN